MKTKPAKHPICPPDPTDLARSVRLGGVPELLLWLRETDDRRLDGLWSAADHTRRAAVGVEVHLRGLVEISNICSRQCAYCGLRAGNTGLQRYRMTRAEILTAARQAQEFGYGTVVLQGGEDPGLTVGFIAETVRAIKGGTGLAVTLSLGERAFEDLEKWRAAGADRYLLRFETSNMELFGKIHPPAGGAKLRRGDHPRLVALRSLRALGYEVGSGIMIGIPGQTYVSVAEDLHLFRDLDLDMIGIGPFIRHPGTPLGVPDKHTTYDQVPGVELMVYKAVALTRLLRPDANIPSTSALATINKRNGRELGLQRGANVFMPNLTPLAYRKLYQIYPAKACLDEPGSVSNSCLTARITTLGRRVGRGAGARRRPGLVSRGRSASAVSTDRK